MDHGILMPFPEAKGWKKDLEELVEKFREKRLVHGDLCLANFVFTKSDNPRKTILVDFDWGGGYVIQPRSIFRDHPMNDGGFNDFGAVRSRLPQNPFCVL